VRRTSRPDALLREAFINTLYRGSAYVEPHIYPRPIRRYSIPTSITAWTLQEYGRRVHRSRHSALRRGLGLLHRLPPAAPEKLAELLRRSCSSRRPYKPLKILCPKADPLRTLLTPHRRARKPSAQPAPVNLRYGEPSAGNSSLMIPRGATLHPNGAARPETGGAAAGKL
jgi:hypothetical protein